MSWGPAIQSIIEPRLQERNISGPRGSGKVSRWMDLQSRRILGAMELTEREKARLRALVERAREETPGDEVLAGLAARLAAGGGPSFAKYAEVLEPGTVSDPDIVERIQRAVTTASRLSIRYTARSTGETTDRVVRPFNVHFYDGREYLEAFCELRGADRVFAVGNIEDAREVPDEGEAGAPN
ncbi:MAG TPA: WYL domain-containing protein [Gemmatimonadota bacterium]|nr:WYL domain-containing protein [Gemmatimonadota bacterium]